MISIIIPVYNRENLVIETLQSISNQSYNDWECIIIDDGSIDNTVEVINDLIKDDTRFKLVKRPQNKQKGPSACRNYGYQLSQGEYIQFFDSDDIMHPEHLKDKISAINESDFVVCEIKSFIKEFDKRLLLDNKSTHPILYNNSIFESFVTGTFPLLMVAPLWRKKILDNYMPLREDMHILEDHELYARILYNSKKYVVINKILIFYRTGLSASTNSFFKDISFGLDSYFKAKTTVLRLSNSKKIKLAILKMTLGFFRMGLSQKKYIESQKCLQFIKKEKLCYSFILKIKLIRIELFYYIFKFLGKGDTKFKSLLKI